MVKKNFFMIVFSIILLGFPTITQSQEGRRFLIIDGKVVHNSAEEKNKNKRYLKGEVEDYATGLPTDSIKTIELLSKDSTVIYKQEFLLKNFGLEVPENGEYIIRCKTPDYHTLYKDVTVKFKRREKERNIGTLRMKRIGADMRMVNLDEVVVKPTQLKFYFDKDTLVYNAQAFTTQKGFVLNDILTKMPGLEIKANGDIYSNGRKVDVLLLNGKDFFNRDRKTILDNLPAFMVKNVKVYDKNKDSTAVIRRDRDFEGLAMDIILKKKYQKFLFGNAEMGLGSDERYQAKGFVTRFHQLYRLSAYALGNNINRDDTFDEMGTAHYSDTDGDRKGIKAGFRYNIDQSRGLYALDGNAEMNYTDLMNSYKISQTTFLDAGDVYKRMSNQHNNYDFNAATNHSINFYGEKRNKLTIEPDFRYGRQHSNQQRLSGVFNTNVANLLGPSWEDSLKTIDPGFALTQFGINRQNISFKRDSETMTGGAHLNYVIGIPYTEDELTISLLGRHTRNEYEDYRHELTDFFRDEKKKNLFTNHYEDKVCKETYVDAKATYKYEFITGSNLYLRLGHIQSERKEDNMVYDLDKLDGWNTVTQSPALGIRPDAMSLSSAIDRVNSYDFTERSRKSVVMLNYIYDKGTLSNKTHFSIMLPFNIEHRELDFASVKDTTLKRKMNTLDIKMKFGKNIQKDGRTFGFELGYELTHSMPALTSLVDRTNSSDMFYLFKGNPELKDMSTHNFSASISYHPHWSFSNSLGINHSRAKNRIVQTLRYDKNTGISVISPYNVNGDNSTSVFLMNTFSPPKNRTWSFINFLNLSHNYWAYLSASNLDEALQKQQIQDLTIDERIGFTKHFSDRKIRLGGSLNMMYKHSSSQWNAFTGTDTYDYGGRIDLTVEFPWDIKFATQCNYIKHAGYNYNKMNNNEVVWNAQLTKSFSEHFTIGLDATDILNQRSNYMQFTNTDGHVESQCNTISRYIMLNAVWRFNTEKKR